MNTWRRIVPRNAGPGKKCQPLPIFCRFRNGDSPTIHCLPSDAFWLLSQPPRGYPLPAEWRPDEKQSRFLGPIQNIAPRKDAAVEILPGLSFAGMYHA